MPIAGRVNHSQGDEIPPRTCDIDTAVSLCGVFDLQVRDDRCEKVIYPRGWILAGLMRRGSS